jgi:hypothetical protein
MPMQTILIILGALVLLFFMTTVFAFILFQDERNKLLFLQGKLNPFRRRQRFLTGNELKLFSILRDNSTLNDFYIFPQLHLSTILEVKDDTNDLAGKFDWLNKLFVDFVIFDKEMNPKLVIELNDSTHTWKSRKARDEFVRKALTENNIPLIEFKTNDLVNPINVANKIINQLNLL